MKKIMCFLQYYEIYFIYKKISKKDIKRAYKTFETSRKIIYNDIVYLQKWIN